MGERDDREDVAVDNLKQYLRTFSKKERDQIQRELEEEGESEDDSLFKPLKITFSRHLPQNKIYFITAGQQRLQWIPSQLLTWDGLSNPVEDDIQDVVDDV